MSWQDVENVVNDFLTNYQEMVDQIMAGLTLQKFWQGLSVETIDPATISFVYKISGEKAKQILSLAESLNFLGYGDKGDEIFHEIFQRVRLERFMDVQLMLSDIKGFNFDNLLESFMSDLLLFEHDFKTRITNAVAHGGDVYKSKVDAQLTKLLSADVDRYNEELPVSILNFNYTMSQWPSKFENQKNTDLVSVHGDVVDDEIIFGIDSFNTFDKDDVNIVSDCLLPFTKTYRTLSLTGEPHKRISGAGMHFIKFYGQSLGQQDYSYFMSLFDEASIYDSDTTLIFYYAPYVDKTPKEVQSETMGRVARLINRYDLTMANPAHGRNLLHKLKMESRLLIKEISFDDEAGSSELENV